MPQDEGTQLIVEEIMREARAEAVRIISNAKADAEKTLEKVKTKARKAEDKALAEARERGELIYDEMLAEGRMKAKREIIRKKDKILNGVLKQAEAKLHRYVSTRRYNVVKLAIEACKKMDSDSIVIYSNKNDLLELRKSKAKIISELSNKGDVDISFGKQIETIGGVLVTTGDGKIEIDDTFEGRIRRKVDDLRVAASRVLFGGS